MDPDACWAIVTAAHTDTEERIDAALDLYMWLDKGGYRPRNYNPTIHAAAVLGGTLLAAVTA
jgi:hypothetical protein